VLTAPDQLREQLRHHNRAQLIRTCQQLRPDTTNTGDPAQAVKVALRSLAHRIGTLDQEATALHTQINALTETTAPTTSALFALGPDTVSALLIAIGDNPDRLRSEAAFARLCGVAPIPASSGKTTRHRLHRGGDRTANRALHLAIIVRLRYHPGARAYAARRTPKACPCPKSSAAKNATSPAKSSPPSAPTTPKSHQPSLR